MNMHLVQSWTHNEVPSFQATSLTGLSVVYQSIKENLNETHHWPAKLLIDFGDPVAGHDSPDLHSGLVDIVPLLIPCPEHQQYLRKQNSFPMGTRFRFPSKFKGWTCHEELVCEIKERSLLTGFTNLAKRGTYPPGSKTNVSKNRLATVLLTCTRYCQYDDSRTDRTFDDGSTCATGVKTHGIHQSKGKSQHSTSYKASSKRARMAEDTCPFSLTIFMGPDELWYLAVASSTKKGGIVFHEGHPPVTPDLMNPGSDCLDDEEVELIKQMERNGADYAMIARTISERTGYLYTANQMRYLSKKEAALADGLNPDASSADNLIAEFRKRYVLRVPCMIRCFRSYSTLL